MGTNRHQNDFTLQVKVDVCISFQHGKQKKNSARFFFWGGGEGFFGIFKGLLYIFVCSDNCPAQV